MITLTIEDSKIQESFDNALTALLDHKNYSNPVKQVLDKLLGYSGSMKEELSKQIESLFTELMTTESFKEKIGVALANEIAVRQVNLLENKFKK